MRELRKIRDEREARYSLTAARRAGGSVGAWARANGVDGRSLNAWRVNLARRSSTRRPAIGTAVRPRAGLVELIPATRPRPVARYTVHVGEARVELGDDFDAGALRRIVEVLRVC